MRIGIFGGSFDPIHLGHLILAERCREAASLDQVWFIPCSLSPHKQQGAHGSDRARAEMIQLAIAGHEAFILSRLELEREGISYTVETLEEIHAQRPDDELFLIMGGDSLDTFATWRNPKRICELAIPLVVGRPEAEKVDFSIFKRWVEESRLQEFQTHTISSPLIDISSSEIRSRIKAEKSVRYLTPRSVEKYIETQELYR